MNGKGHTILGDLKILADDVKEYKKLKLISEMIPIRERIKLFENKYNLNFREFEDKIKQQSEDFKLWDDYIEWKAYQNKFEEIKEKKGKNGFGYDPIFFFEEYGKTFAQLTMEEKNKVSHRGKALAEIKDEKEKIKIWIEQRLSEEKSPKPDHDLFKDNDWSS